MAISRALSENMYGSYKGLNILTRWRSALLGFSELGHNGSGTSNRVDIVTLAIGSDYFSINDA